MAASIVIIYANVRQKRVNLQAKVNINKILTV